MSDDILEAAKYVLGKRDLFGSQNCDEHTENCPYIHPHCLIEGLVTEIVRLRESLNVIAACFSEMGKGLEKHLLKLPPEPETKEVPRD